MDELQERRSEEGKCEIKDRERETIKNRWRPANAHTHTHNLLRV